MKKTTIIALTIAFIFAIALIGEASAITGAGAGEEKVKTIIVFKNEPTSDDVGFLEKQGGTVVHRFGIIPGVSVEFPQQALDKICKEGSRSPVCDKINYIELDQQVHTYVKPEGKGNPTPKPTPVQLPQVLPWGIDRTDAELSWGISTGYGVKVAVVDTGIDYTHPDLDANVAGCVTFVWRTTDCRDDNGHGTHVAGTIAAENNGIGVVGVAPNASLYGVKVLDRTGSGYVSDVIAGIDWSADNGMNVITMSLGSGSDVSALHAAVDSAYSRGIVIVASAGNENGTISYPARYSSVIAVTATDSGNNKASFSNYGPEAELAAPGVSIYSTYKGGTYATLSGTSMAAPHVTGTVALLLEANPGMTPLEVRSRLQSTSTDIGTPGWDPYFGHGLVNAYGALSTP